MKLHNPYRHKNEFIAYRPVVTGSTTTYQEAGTYKGSITSVATGSVGLISPNALPVGWVIRSLKDAGGTEILTDDGISYDLYVQASSPVLNGWGILTGTRLTLGRSMPKDYRQALIDAVN